MTSHRSLFRAAALTGAMAFLFSLAHVSPVAAQTTTPYGDSCSAYATAGNIEGECTVPVPAGKRFVIESATVGGAVPGSQYARVQIFTKVGGRTLGHFVPAAFYNPNVSFPFWTGALPGKIVAEGPTVKLRYSRGSGTTGATWMWMVVSGYLEDL
jgi:hypothetical protein